MSERQALNERQLLIIVDNLCMGYGEGATRVNVLKRLSLDVKEGEMIAIVGQSGVGKSTLLHLVGLLDRPESGTLELDGEDVATLNATERAHLRNRSIGFVFQHHHLLDELDAIENVALPLRIAGHRASDALEQAEELLLRVGLENRKDHFPDQLSGGEQQRVALARALVMKPKLLLADEPTGNLDALNSDIVFDLIRDLHLKQNLTSIIVTHNEAMARRCDRLFRLMPIGEKSSYVREI